MRLACSCRASSGQKEHQLFTRTEGRDPFDSLGDSVDRTPRKQDAERWQVRPGPGLETGQLDLGDDATGLGPTAADGFDSGPSDAGAGPGERGHIQMDEGGGRGDRGEKEEWTGAAEH